MTLAKTIESYTIWYMRCTELSKELSSLSTKEYLAGDDVPVRHRLSYYAELLEIKGKELNDLGIDVDLHETFTTYAQMWKENADLASEVTYGSA